jgi:hypothetical protein
MASCVCTPNRGMAALVVASDVGRLRRCDRQSLAVKPAHDRPSNSLATAEYPEQNLA